VLPGTGTLDVLELAAVLGAAGQIGESLAVELEVGNDVDDLGGEALLAGSDDGTLGVGERDDSTAELNDLGAAYWATLPEPEMATRLPENDSLPPEAYWIMCST